MDDKTVNQDLNGNDDNILNIDDNNLSGEGNQYTETEKQLYARMKKERAEKEALKAELSKIKGSQQKPTLSDDDWREKIELRTMGYNDEAEIDFILKNGGKKALEDSFVKMAIERKREESEAKNKIAMNISSKSSIERKYTAQDLKSMTSDEMEAILRKG